MSFLMIGWFAGHVPRASYADATFASDRPEECGQFARDRGTGSFFPAELSRR